MRRVTASLPKPWWQPSPRSRPRSKSCLGQLSVPLLGLPVPPLAPCRKPETKRWQLPRGLHGDPFKALKPGGATGVKLKCFKRNTSKQGNTSRSPNEALRKKFGLQAGSTAFFTQARPAKLKLSWGSNKGVIPPLIRGKHCHHHLDFQAVWPVSEFFCPLGHFF